MSILSKSQKPTFQQVQKARFNDLVPNFKFLKNHRLLLKFALKNARKGCYSIAIYLAELPAWELDFLEKLKKSRRIVIFSTEFITLNELLPKVEISLNEVIIESFEIRQNRAPPNQHNSIHIKKPFSVIVSNGSKVVSKIRTCSIEQVNLSVIDMMQHNKPAH